MEKILLEYKEGDHQLLMANVQRAFRLVEPVVKEIQDTFKIEIDNNLLHNLLFVGSPESVAQAIRNKVADDLKRAGISSKGIKDAAITADLETFYKIFNPFEYKRNLSDREGLKGLEMHNGEVMIIPNYEEKTREQFCRYVTTPEGKELYECYQATFAAITEFKKMLPNALKSKTLRFFHCNIDGEISQGEKIDFDWVLQTYEGNKDIVKEPEEIVQEAEPEQKEQPEQEMIQFEFND